MVVSLIRDKQGLIQRPISVFSQQVPSWKWIFHGSRRGSRRLKSFNLFMCVFMLALTAQCFFFFLSVIWECSILGFVSLYVSGDPIYVIEFGLFCCLWLSKCERRLLSPPKYVSLADWPPWRWWPCVPIKRLSPPPHLSWMVILLQLNGFQGFLRNTNQEWFQTVTSVPEDPIGSPLLEALSKAVPLERAANSDWHLLFHNSWSGLHIISIIWNNSLKLICKASSQFLIVSFL